MPTKSTMTDKERQLKAQEKASKFIQLANKRVNKSVKAIRQISNLGNRNSYISSQEQRTRIVAALRTAVDSVEDSFIGTKVTDGNFKL